SLAWSVLPYPTLFRSMLDADPEHRLVDLPELLGLDAGRHDRVDLLVGRPDVLERDRVALRIVAEHVLLDVEAHGAGDRVGDHQRSEEHTSELQSRENL